MKNTKGKADKLDALLEKHSKIADEAYEIGFHAAKPTLCLSPPNMGREEDGEESERDCDYEVWNLEKLINQRLRFADKVTKYPDQEDVLNALKWAVFFKKASEEFASLANRTRRRVHRQTLKDQKSQPQTESPKP